MPDDDDLRDDEVRGGSGIEIVMIVALVAVFLAFLSVYGLLRSFNKKPPGVATCTTTCLGVVKLECPGDRYIGVCFGLWECSGGTHPCGTDVKLDFPQPPDRLSKRDRDKTLPLARHARSDHVAHLAKRLPAPAGASSPPH